MYISNEDARIHNLVIRFAKRFSVEELPDAFDSSVLSNELYFREEDFDIAITGKILKENDDKYVPTQRLIEKVANLRDKKKNDEKLLKRLEKEYIDKFEILNESGSYKANKELIKLASEIHWYILPEYEEYMIVNSEIYPNENPEEYYNHFHTLEDLYMELIGQGKNVKSKKGDTNLNRKITIQIYSRRWGHFDPYIITRTTKGWTVLLHWELEGNKEGDALIKTLNHDFINYPHNLGTFMWHLWNKADSQEMSIYELENDLNKIVDWINICEKNTPAGIEV